MKIRKLRGYDEYLGIKDLKICYELLEIFAIADEEENNDIMISVFAEGIEYRAVPMKDYEKRFPKLVMAVKRNDGFHSGKVRLNYNTVFVQEDGENWEDFISKVNKRLYKKMKTDGIV